MKDQQQQEQERQDRRRSDIKDEGRGRSEGEARSEDSRRRRRRRRAILASGNARVSGLSCICPLYAAMRKHHSDPASEGWVRMRVQIGTWCDV
jgi:hypothetical protein